MNFPVCPSAQSCPQLHGNKSKDSLCKSERELGLCQFCLQNF